MRHRAPSHGTQPRTACNNLRTGLTDSVLAIARSVKRSCATSGAASRDQRGRDARLEARDQRRNIALHLLKTAATSAGNCASSARPLAHKRAGMGAAMRGGAVAFSQNFFVDSI
ncbi:hypothetical protein F511_45969 [Dorcoceras hygrometricum]|uniref:Uncharacterized protein n=1 Tax=Dorcoceras hygrometricum TaxID=472368 RepID=A0A2Z6ZUP2_9LAMI|nr:hypothetical protein F511_45969 [Dorcoceras hygrometricum]